MSDFPIFQPKFSQVALVVTSKPVKLLSPVWLFGTPWTIALQAPLSTGFSRQEYWSRLPCLPPGDCPWPRNWTRVSCSEASACNAGDLGSIPGLGRSPGEGNGNPLQYSCLENPHGWRSLVGYSPWGCKESDWSDLAHTHATRALKPRCHMKFPNV